MTENHQTPYAFNAAGGISLNQPRQRSLIQQDLLQENKRIKTYENISPVPFDEVNDDENIIPKEILDEFFCAPLF